MKRSHVTADRRVDRPSHGTWFRISLLAVVLIAIVEAACGSDSEPPVVSQEPDEGSEHVAVGEPHAPFGTVPATSGPHWSSFPTEGAPFGAPVVWGFYEEVIVDEALVHNLEHGGIGLHYNCPDGCPDLTTRLTGLVPVGSSQFVMSPYPDMPSRIAITAWRRVLRLDEFDGVAITAFIMSYQDKAPESVASNPAALGADCGPPHAVDSDADSVPAIGGSCSQ